MNSSGQILAQAIIGQSQRLVRLTPAVACTTGCLRVNSLVITAKFVQDPQRPGQCFQGGKMFNRARAVLTVTNEAGTPVDGVTLIARFLDDYWTNKTVTATTNNRGMAAISYTGLCGVSAIVFFVDNLTKANLTFDKTTETLSSWAIPK
jgi:hypothetical protein